MTRITCPECGIRYNVPNSVLQAGRKVRCESCGRIWRATPSETPLETAADEDRAHQLAEIRRIADDVHQKASIAPPKPPAQDSGADMPGTERSEPIPPAPVPRAPNPNESDSLSATLERQVDAARERRRAVVSGRGRVQERMEDRMVDLLGTRMKDRDAKRDKLRGHSGRQGGIFSTGFLLVLILAAGLSSLYVFAPQIGDRFPEARPILSNYKVKVDDAGVIARKGVKILKIRIKSLLLEYGVGAPSE